MDQRYEGLGLPHAPQVRENLEERLRDFLQSIDQDSTFRVRTRHGFTQAASKGWVGLHQGETLSPSKYSWSVDPLLEYLESLAESKGLGIDLGSILIDGEEIFFEGSYTVHTAKGDVITADELAARLDGVELLFVGESHTDYEFHQVQLRTIEELQRRGRGDAVWTNRDAMAHARNLKLHQLFFS